MSNGDVVGSFGITADFFVLAVESSPMSAIVFDNSFRIIYANDAFINGSGLEKNIVGKNLEDIFRPRHSRTSGRLIPEDLYPGERAQLEVTYNGPDNEKRWADVFVVKDEDDFLGEICLAFVVDITGRRTAMLEMSTRLSYFDSLMDPVFIFEANREKEILGCPVFLNSQAVKLLDGFEEFTFSDFVFTAEKDRNIFFSELFNKDFSIAEAEILTHNGRKPFELKGSLLEKEECCFFVISARNIENRQVLLESIQEQKEFFKQLFANSSEAIFLIDPDGRVLMVNSAFEEMMGYSQQEISGKHISEVVAPMPWIEGSKKIIAKAKKEKVLEKHLIRQTKKGEFIHVKATVSPIVIDGTEKAYFGMYSDISEQMRLQGEIYKEKEYFRQLFDNSPQACVAIDLRGNIVNANNSFGRIFGYTMKETVGFSIDGLIGGTNREEAEKVTLNAFSGVTIRQEAIRYDKYGEEVEVSMMAYPIYDQAGDIEGIFAIYEDITQRKQTERILLLFEKIFSVNTEAIIVFDASFHVMYTNSAFERITGLNREDLRDMNPVEFMDGDFSGGSLENIDEAIRNCGSWAGELVLRKKENSFFPAMVRYYRVSYEKNPNKHYTVIIFSDITERKAKEKKIHTLAYTDALTGVLNRSSFIIEMEKAVASNVGTGGKFAVIYIDLDKFKKINDNWGHAEGDRVLCEASARIKSCVRENDRIARFGGDEFVVLLPDTGERTEAEKICRRIENVLRKPYEIKGVFVEGGGSTGLSLFPDDGYSVDEVINTADQRMYMKKKVKE